MAKITENGPPHRFLTFPIQNVSQDQPEPAWQSVECCSVLQGPPFWILLPHSDVLSALASVFLLPHLITGDHVITR